MGRNRRGVRRAYTWPKLKDDVLYWRGGKQPISFREIAAMFDDKVTFGAVQRISLGIEPKTARVRQGFRLPVYETILVCSRCGVVHPQRKSCPTRSVSNNERKPRKNWKGLAVWLVALMLYQDEYK